MNKSVMTNAIIALSKLPFQVIINKFVGKQGFEEIHEYIIVDQAGKVDHYYGRLPTIHFELEK